MPPLSPASAHSAASAADLSLQWNRGITPEGFVPFARSLQHNNTIQRLWWATLRRVNCSSPSRLTDSDNGPRPHFSAAISLDGVLNYDVAPEGVAAFTRALAVNRSLVSLECVADRRRAQNGQDGGRRGLALARQTESVRLLAVLEE